MQVQNVPVSSLIAYSLNNVKHPDEQVDRIANSIRQFGWTVPLLINAENIIIAGHGRLLAAKKLGLKEVPCLRAEDMSEADQRAYRILDNKLTRDSEWDFENLGLEFDFLKEDGFDFAAWGLEKLIPAVVENILDASPPPIADNRQYLVVIECASEGEQQNLYDEFQNRGLKCKLIT